jgi:starch phosphorylase
VPWDIPVVGFGGHTVNILRLWESRASEFFDWDVFNAGGYIDSQAEKAQAETISKVLYPNDETDAGKELRLIQQYFFCACSIKDIMRRYKRVHGSDFSNFAAQCHPAQRYPPHRGHPRADARAGGRTGIPPGICYQVFSYTNHTLLPEALEKWSVSLFEKVLPVISRSFMKSTPAS